MSQEPLRQGRFGPKRPIASTWKPCPNCKATKLDTPKKRKQGCCDRCFNNRPNQRIEP